MKALAGQEDRVHDERAAPVRMARQETVRHKGLFLALTWARSFVSWWGEKKEAEEQGQYPQDFKGLCSFSPELGFALVRSGN